MARGTLISIEGISGAGKSTLCDDLRAHLDKKGHQVLFKRDLRQYTGEKIGADIKKILAKYSPRVGVFDFSPVSVATLLILAKRAFESETALGPALKEGSLVLADRDIDTVCVYQALLFDTAEYPMRFRQIVNVLRTINAWSVVPPKLTLYLEGDVEVCLKRAEDRETDPDPITPKKRQFSIRAIDAFDRAFAMPLPGRKLVRLNTTKLNRKQMLAAAIREVEQCI